MTEKATDGSVEENQIHCYAYMSGDGRIYVPLRHREEAGLTDRKGVEIELVASIKKVFE